MKTLLLFLMLATPALAKTWVNEGCTLAVTSDKAGFHYETTIINEAATFDTLCTVADWPISSEVATMKCDNGSAPKMTIVSDDAITFDGKTFSTKNACVDE